MADKVPSFNEQSTKYKDLYADDDDLALDVNINAVPISTSFGLSTGQRKSYYSFLLEASSSKRKLTVVNSQY